MFPSLVIFLSALLLSTGVIKAESHLDFNYQLLARDWVDRPDSFCGSTEQSPIDLNGHYMPFPTNFMPMIQLPTISGISVINTGENINIDFDIDESRLKVYSPVNSSFTDLYGTYAGTGVSPPPRNRGLRGPRSGSRDQKMKAKKHHSSKGPRSGSRDQKMEASRHSDDEDLVMIEAASLKSEVTSESNAGILGDIHWHVPSEHTVNGRLAAAEMHLVHFVVRPGDDSCQFEYKGEQACIVVIGILFDLVYDGAEEMSHGDNRTNLLEFLGPLPVYGDTSSVVVEGSFDLNSVLPSNNNTAIWTYRGSLTTPECNENVTWVVVQEPHPIGWSQWSELRNVIVTAELGDLNARPPQPRNDRVVYEGTFQHEQTV